jgi:hypothetical protein
MPVLILSAHFFEMYLTLRRIEQDILNIRTSSCKEPVFRVIF